jgi:hypothetical protein
MSKVYINATVSKDGSLTIPAFAARGLGYEPGDEVCLALPTDLRSCDCQESELLVTPVCAADEEEVPTRQEAGVSLLCSDGMMIVAVTEKEHIQDLTDALSCLMEELGFDPETVETVKG